MFPLFVFQFAKQNDARQHQRNAIPHQQWQVVG
jgi:hypothetical protein